ADGDQMVLRRGLDDPEALREQDVRAGADLRECGFLGRRGIEPAVEEGHLYLDLRVDFLRTTDEGVDDAVHLGHRVTTYGAERVRIRQAAGEHPGDVRRLVDPVVEEGKVG